MITQFSIRILFMKYSHLLSTIIQLILAEFTINTKQRLCQQLEPGVCNKITDANPSCPLAVCSVQAGYIILFCLLFLSCKVVIILLSSPRTLMQLNHLLHTKCFEECMHYRKPRLFARSINQQQQRTWCFRHSTSHFII